MSGLPSVLYLLICLSCLSWQTSSSLSEKAFQDHLPPPIFRLDDLIHISLHREKRAAKANITMSPGTLFQGDTVTIDCAFSELGNISWYLNMTMNISDSQKYQISSSQQGTMVQYTLEIRNCTDADKGSYTCSLLTSGAPLNQTTIISTIKTLQIQSSNDMDSYCDGAPFNLTCCFADIGEFNMTWTLNDTSGIAGTTTNNENCSIYTLTPNITQSCHSIINYNCSFIWNEGATISKIIKVTYIQRASISIPSSISMSYGKSQQIICNTNIPLTTIVWAKHSLTNIVSNSIYLFIDNASTAWSGTYFCIVYQGSLSTSASVTVNIVPLPQTHEISFYTLSPIITNGANAKLTCCVSGSGNGSSYSISFTSNTPVTSDSNPNCHSTIVGCTTGSPITVSCVVYNSLNDSVISDGITITCVEEQSENCKEDTSQGLPSSPSGFTYDVSCTIREPSFLGTINYNCTDGIWNETAHFCFSATVFQQLVDVQDVMVGPKIQQALPQLLENIWATAFKEKQNIADSSRTLQLMVDIISKVSNANVEVDPSMMQNFIKTVDVVVGTSSAWNNNADKSVTILNSVEKFAQNMNFNGTINFGDDSLSNIQLYGQVVSKDESYNVDFSIQNLTGNVFIDGGALSDNSITVVTIAYGTMKDILPNTTHGVLNGLVMSTFIVKNSGIKIDSNTFKINMNFSESYSSLSSPECVWYDSEQNVWNNSDCTSVRVDNVISCSCNHLASLSILMGSSIEETFLEIITFIAVGISLACLVLALLIEALVWNSVIKNKTSYIRHVCLVNVAVTLLIADIWFITAVALDENIKSPACKAAAYFGFFFYLCGFFWMLNTGLFLFYRVIYVLHDMNKKTMMIIAFLLGYGCPLLITIITVASTEPSKRFISSQFCWFDYSDSRSFFAFLGPVLVITFVNILILVVVISKLMRCTIAKQSGKKGRMIFLWITKTFVILNPLLGITWGFELGVLIHPEDIVIRGIFATFKSFQGLFILISTAMLTKWCGKQ